MCDEPMGAGGPHRASAERREQAGIGSLAESRGVLMKRVSNRRLLGATLLMVAPLCIATLVPAPLRDWRAAEGGKGLSSGQVPAMAAHVCRAVAPDSMPDEIVVQYEPALPEAAEGAEWTAVCRRAGAARADVVCRWNVATGRLEYVEHAIAQPDPTSRPASPRDAVRQAGRWVRSLDMVDAADALELARAPVRNSLAWVVHLRAGRRLATVRLTLSGCALQSVRVIERSDALPGRAIESAKLTAQTGRGFRTVNSPSGSVQLAAVASAANQTCREHVTAVAGRLRIRRPARRRRGRPSRRASPPAARSAQ